MDKGRQPTLWNNHNLNSLADEAFRRTEEKRRARAIGEILDQPDGYEDNEIDSIVRKDSLSDLDRMLGLAFNIGISPKSLSKYTTSAKLFNPHESVVDSSNAIPVEVHTSVVAFDVYESTTSNRKNGAKVGSILLPKLSANLIDEPAPDMTAKDLIWSLVFGSFLLQVMKQLSLIKRWKSSSRLVEKWLLLMKNSGIIAR